MRHDVFSGNKFNKIRFFSDALTEVVNRGMIPDDEVAAYLKGYLDSYIEIVHAIERDMNQHKNEENEE